MPELSVRCAKPKSIGDDTRRRVPKIQYVVIESEDLAEIKIVGAYKTQQSAVRATFKKMVKRLHAHLDNNATIEQWVAKLAPAPVVEQPSARLRRQDKTRPKDYADLSASKIKKLFERFLRMDVNCNRLRIRSFEEVWSACSPVLTIRLCKDDYRYDPRHKLDFIDLFRLVVYSGCFDVCDYAYCVKAMNYFG